MRIGFDNKQTRFGGVKKGEKKEKEKNVNKKAGPVGVLMLHCVELHDGSPPAKYALSSQSWYYLESNFSKCSTTTFRLKKRERERKKERLSWV